MELGDNILELKEQRSGHVRKSDAETPTDTVDKELLTKITNEIFEKMEEERKSNNRMKRVLRKEIITYGKTRLLIQLGNAAIKKIS